MYHFTENMYNIKIPFDIKIWLVVTYGRELNTHTSNGIQQYSELHIKHRQSLKMCHILHYKIKINAPS